VSVYELTAPPGVLDAMKDLIDEHVNRVVRTEFYND
jgi:hypothetical protein